MSDRRPREVRHNQEAQARPSDEEFRRALLNQEREGQAERSQIKHAIMNDAKEEISKVEKAEALINQAVKGLDKNIDKADKIIKEFYKEIPKGVSHKKLVEIQNQLHGYRATHKKLSEQIKSSRIELKGAETELRRLYTSMRLYVEPVKTSFRSFLQGSDIKNCADNAYKVSKETYSLRQQAHNEMKRMDKALRWIDYYLNPPSYPAPPHYSNIGPNPPNYVG